MRAADSTLRVGLNAAPRKPSLKSAPVPRPATTRESRDRSQDAKRNRLPVRSDAPAPKNAPVWKACAEKTERAEADGQEDEDQADRATPRRATHVGTGADVERLGAEQRSRRSSGNGAKRQDDADNGSDYPAGRADHE